jgi:hypothetical protein
MVFGRDSHALEQWFADEAHYMRQQQLWLQAFPPPQRHDGRCPHQTTVIRVYDAAGNSNRAAVNPRVPRRAALFNCPSRVRVSIAGRRDLRCYLYGAGGGVPVVVVPLFSKKRTKQDFSWDYFGTLKMLSPNLA